MRRGIFPIIAAAAIALLPSCQDEVSSLGSSLTHSEVSIEVDSTFTVTGSSVYTPVFDSRSTDNLIGRLRVPEYGSLTCSFVAQLLSAGAMPINDSIGVERVDSMKLILRIPRGGITGDSLAPQQVKVYRLTKDLPSDINNSFDPTGYYSESSLLGTRSYAANALGMNDSIFYKSKYIDIQVPMPLDLAREIFTMYRNGDPILQWPATFNKWFKGIYVEPSFGRGCLSNIKAANMVTYYHYYVLRTVVEDDESVQKQVTMKDSVTLMATAPEVLSSNNIKLDVSDNVRDLVAQGKAVIQSPAGYNVRITFPTRQILDRYTGDNFTMAMINNLIFTIPAKAVHNDFGIGLPPYLLMVKTSELDTFFAGNSLPDEKTSFWASYSSSSGGYTFTSMLSYIRDIMDRGEMEEGEDDFTLVPVYIETYTNSYTSSTSVTQCTPYLYKPTMGIFDLDAAKVVFTYSKQTIY